MDSQEPLMGHATLMKSTMPVYYRTGFEWLAKEMTSQVQIIQTHLKKSRNRMEVQMDVDSDESDDDDDDDDVGDGSETLGNGQTVQGVLLRIELVLETAAGYIKMTKTWDTKPMIVAALKNGRVSWRDERGGRRG
eukprot:TRINITY_DN1298_c0_g1_i1.p1 TRINITY_DN1298_c0_g1~~TRINITY_DN1298_c0_g1_i1.p1  ORF type:complete len:135 (+),score=44.51 TRINITY_DN1298_c0_g1_i1:132-536(+)